MENAKRQRGGGPILAAVLIAALVLLPVAYLLSIGPAYGLHVRGYLSLPVYDAYLGPARFVFQRCDPVLDALDWYASFFDVG